MSTDDQHPVSQYQLSPVCPYCNNKRKWTKRLTQGYKTTCCSKECESKRISIQKTGQTIISNNRDKDFIEKQEPRKLIAIL